MGVANVDFFFEHHSLFDYQHFFKHGDNLRVAFVPLDRQFPFDKAIDRDRRDRDGFPPQVRVHRFQPFAHSRVNTNDPGFDGFSVDRKFFGDNRNRKGGLPFPQEPEKPITPD